MDPTSAPPVPQSVTIPAENSVVLPSTPVNRKWTKGIPTINWICVVISLLLLFGLDLLILLTAGSGGLLTQEALFQIWIIMLAVFAVFLVLFFLENFSFKKRFADSKSRLDNWIIVIVVIRNLLVLCSSTPLIHLLVWALGWVLTIPLTLIYLLLILKRFQVRSA